ncbi:MAG: FdrA family protein [Thermoleophilia bacterium]|nr:FdrA family protein [Thermoleophilia bacterium]
MDANTPDDVVVDLPLARDASERDDEPTGGEAGVAGLIVIGVPGAYAVLEAHRAVAAGSDVMLITADVSLADEVALKRRARSAGRLVMGPGCDTMIIDGIAIGVANVVTPGRVGVIATSGSAAQEASVLLDRFGVGVSQCMVTGGRDLSDDVGGITTLTALERLGSDPTTEAIVLVADAYSVPTAQAVMTAVASAGRPAVVCLIGNTMSPPDGVDLYSDIDQAVLGVARIAGARPVIPAAEPTGWVSAGHVRGIFSGTALCAEASAILAERLGRVVSNSPAGAAEALDPRDVVRGNACLDLAAESVAHGTAHPILDPTRRADLIVETVSDHTVAVILIDVILGLGAHPDPAGALAPVLARALQARPSLQVVAHVCGTAADPQSLARQEEELTRVGVRLAPTSGQAARLAAALVRSGR